MANLFPNNFKYSKDHIIGLNALPPWDQSWIGRIVTILGDRNYGAIFIGGIDAWRSIYDPSVTPPTPVIPQNTFDAIVSKNPVAGEYPSIQAARAAGKRNIFIKKGVYQINTPEVTLPDFKGGGSFDLLCGINLMDITGSPIQLTGESARDTVLQFNYRLYTDRSYTMNFMSFLIAGPFVQAAISDFDEYYFGMRPVLSNLTIQDNTYRSDMSDILLVGIGVFGCSYENVLFKRQVFNETAFNFYGIANCNFIKDSSCSVDLRVDSAYNIMSYFNCNMMNACVLNMSNISLNDSANFYGYNQCANFSDARNEIHGLFNLFTGVYDSDNYANISFNVRGESGTNTIRVFNSSKSFVNCKAVMTGNSDVAISFYNCSDMSNLDSDISGIISVSKTDYENCNWFGFFSPAPSVATMVGCTNYFEGTSGGLGSGVLEVNFDFNDVPLGYKTLGIVPSNCVVYRVSLEVFTVFNGVLTMTVGDILAQARLMPFANMNLTYVDTYMNDIDVEYALSTEIRLFFIPTLSPTVGSGNVKIYYARY